MSTQASRVAGGLTVTIAVAAALVHAPAVQGQESDAVERGRAIYHHQCAPCHGPGPGDDGRAMLPGTAALAIKYRGELPALLEERTDLTTDVLKIFIRRGTWSMPPFRPTEVSDLDIEDIGAYLAASARSSRTGSAAER